jgi:hypothetical protein
MILEATDELEITVILAETGGHGAGQSQPGSRT